MRHTRKHLRKISHAGESFTVRLIADPEPGGYIAEVFELPGCITQGENISDALDNTHDAIRCYLKAHAELAEVGIHVVTKRRGLRR